MNKPQTIYEKLGGENAMKAAVPLFYKKVLADERVKHFFKNTDMDHQTKQQTDFLTMLLGGPNHYKGKNMTEAHKGMNLQNLHFDAIIENLAATLKELGVTDAVINEAAKVIEHTRKDMLGK
uniref:Group 1 truncated hemoglobin n=1 Tax=Tetrahymena pyriformis TaxID=5908 RepID=TRHBN_TETPY|nr:RecName: Full=Group 1 truncated hemoglobin; Short=Truncated Hb; AltName: Full=Hemoglobin; AltName: Full=Myoglobin [Tetrahymena pyriformis]3AQ5_A Chain A, Group 1 truncated hemoglobin [Tetrahymena pyriformis]3AQ5_B Chain B, Group 1 truncated hemoglobin [Tetrahymena pyriformis]3AQ6_A Chain A, Group 1 truncated hemoglobin [Tetrahymena pyriformis]3AQ6_B Chain B, Group 1 truncated hemoglobin [Tetrahymena pyriformis]BAA03015.1 hemoglobin [Tetrahymena pyriformis]